MKKRTNHDLALTLDMFFSTCGDDKINKTAYDFLINSIEILKLTFVSIGLKPPESIEVNVETFRALKVLARYGDYDYTYPDRFGRSDLVIHGVQFKCGGDD